ncbi:carbonic anhydrase [Caulobacter segnis]
MVCSCYGHLDEHGRTRALSLENVVVQINHLRTHPSVASGLAKGELTLHGWFFEIETGQIQAYNGDTGRFERRSTKARAAGRPASGLPPHGRRRSPGHRRPNDPGRRFSIAPRRKSRGSRLILSREASSRRSSSSRGDASAWASPRLRRPGRAAWSRASSAALYSSGPGLIAVAVSGPAVGLAVIVPEIVAKHGLSMLGPILVVAGPADRRRRQARQLVPRHLAGRRARHAGRHRRADRGGQFHVLFGDTPKAHGSESAAIPSALAGVQFASSPHPGRGRPGRRRGDADRLDPVVVESSVPRPLSCPGRPAGRRRRHDAGHGLRPGRRAEASALSVDRRGDRRPRRRRLRPHGRSDASGDLPSRWPHRSAETLLSAAAVGDRNTTASAPRQQQHELAYAQSAVRPGHADDRRDRAKRSANVQAGAFASRMSAILHGVWIPAFVALLPWLAAHGPQRRPGRGPGRHVGWKPVGPAARASPVRPAMACCRL